MTTEKPEKREETTKPEEKEQQPIKKGKPPTRKKISPGTYQDEEGKMIKTGQGRQEQERKDDQ